MKITKRQLRRIIKEVKRKLLREGATGGIALKSLVTLEFANALKGINEQASDSREHHWPSADNELADVVDTLVVSWTDMEMKAWSAGDPSMNMGGELSDTESKEWWNEQVDAASEELQDTLRERLRAESIKVMEDFTDRLINGDFT